MARTEPLNVFFLGSGIFAVPVLEALVSSPRIRVTGLATQPDREAGRRRQLTPTPLGRRADEMGLACLRTKSVNTPEFLDTVRKASPDVVVVVSFGQLLKEELLSLPRLGCFNVHASLLPRYRGASPIVTAVLNGDEVSGVSFMRMEKGLDTGPVYEMHRCPVPPEMTADELERTLSALAAEKIESCLLRLDAGEVTAVPQGEEGVSVAVKIRKSDGAVDWREDAVALARKVRAYHSWPSMSFRFSRKNRVVNVKIMRASWTSWESPDAVPGKFIAYSNNKMMISCGKGSLVVERILPEGKKEMPVADFLNGSRIAVGEVLLNGRDDLPS